MDGGDLKPRRAFYTMREITVPRYGPLSVHPRTSMPDSLCPVPEQRSPHAVRGSALSGLRVVARYGSFALHVGVSYGGTPR